MDALQDQGARSIHRVGDEVHALFPWPSNARGFVSAIEAVIRANTSSRDPKVSWKPASPDEWSGLWSRELRSQVVTGRIRVRPLPTWTKSDPHPAGTGNDSPGIEILLVPGLAFGTPHHPTTLGCLQALESVVREGDRVIDVGTGSGILAIAAARLGAGKVLALDPSAEACETATRNARANQVDDRVEIRRTRAVPSEPIVERRFDGVVANLESAVLIPLIPRLVSAVSGGGWLLLSGTPTHEKTKVLSEVEGPHPTGLRPSRELSIDGWWTGVFTSAPP